MRLGVEDRYHGNFTRFGVDALWWFEGKGTSTTRDAPSLDYLSRERAL